MQLQSQSRRTDPDAVSEAGRNLRRPSYLSQDFKFAIVIESCALGRFPLRRPSDARVLTEVPRRPWEPEERSDL